ncbi:MAG: OsmC family protein [Planctomycetota bacterium]|jgi:putative redox protein
MAGQDPVVVTVSGRGGSYTQSIQARQHAVGADEPRELGGEDTAPTPYELLLAALGSCTSITMTMYAKRKEWPLQGVDVELRHRKIHADDCAGCETEKGMLDHIDRRIALHGPLDEAQRARLMEIADKCPVHRTLEGEIHITSSEVPA